jgi:hypothetical protein
VADEKPAFRPAHVVLQADADAAISSGDFERIRLALIDGSRCLDLPLKLAKL